MFKVSKAVFNLALLLVGISIVTAASYFFAYHLLREPLAGSDSYSVLTYAVYLAEHFPRTPLWYPLQGAGESFVLGYPPLYAFTLAFFSKVFNYRILDVMSVVNFLTILLTALGVYAFVFFRLRNQIGAIFAGIFFLLSPFPYALVTGGGFLANAYADIFTIFAFIFFDAYLVSYLERAKPLKNHIYLLFSAVFFTLGTLAHPVATIGLMVLMAIYFPLVGLLNYGKEGLKRSIGAFLKLGVVVFLTSWFWFSPFSKYTNFSNRDITFTADVSTLPPLTLWSVMGIDKSSYELLANLSVPVVVWVFAIIGGALSLFKKDKRVFAIFVIAFVSIVLTGTHAIWYIVTKVNWLAGSFLVHRYYFTSTIIIPPIAGAMGVWYLAALPFSLIKRRTLQHLAWPVITLISLVIFYLGTSKLSVFSSYYDKNYPRNLPYGEEAYLNLDNLWSRASPYPFRPCIHPKDSEKYNYRCDLAATKKYTVVDLLIKNCEEHPKANGTEIVCLGGRTDSNGVFVHATDADYEEFAKRCSLKGQPDYVYDVCLAFQKDPKSQLSYWPKILLAPNEDLNNLETARYAKEDFGQRIDITPSIGSWVKEWNMFNRSGMVNAYTGQLILNKSFNSFFRDLLYSGLAKESTAVDEVTKYFGVSGIIVDTKLDPLGNYETLGWNMRPLNTGSYNFVAAPEKRNLFTVASKPKVLVIGSVKNQAYIQTFKLAVQGMLSYDKALLFEGKSAVDDYNATELKNFDLLILHGAEFKNRSKSYSILKEYLASGGNVFIQTGWQYVSSDWGKEDGSKLNLPEIMPVSSLYWNGKDVIDWNNSEIDESVKESVDPAKFEPLKWGDMAWSGSVADLDSVRPWAKSLVSTNGKVLMAGGAVEKGKIIWSGINIFAHSVQNYNQDEVRLLRNSFNYLLSGKEAVEISDMSVNRDFPDRIEITVNKDLPSGHTLYFKENYYPYWKARLENSGLNKSLKIYTAGPRFMAVVLPEVKSGSKIVLKFSPGTGFVFPLLITIATVGYVLFVLFTGKSGPELKFKPRLNLDKIKKGIVGDEDDDY